MKYSNDEVKSRVGKYGVGGVDSLMYETKT